MLLDIEKLSTGLSCRSVLFILQEERLHDVLGHFEKDFEGEVTAENLGKFGSCSLYYPTVEL